MEPESRVTITVDEVDGFRITITSVPERAGLAIHLGCAGAFGLLFLSMLDKRPAPQTDVRPEGPR